MINDLPKKINIGCGFDKRPGFLNVDMDPNCKPDLLITDNNFSQLPRKFFNHLIAYDVLEHIHRSETVNALLEWSDLMTIGAHIEVETSNVLAIVDLMREDQSFLNHWKCSIFMYGNQAHDGDYHHTGFTEVTLRTYLAAAGFQVDELIHHLDWIILVHGRKVEDWSALADQSSDISDHDFVVAAYEQALARLIHRVGPRGLAGVA
ncbi:methyltransferase [Novosphingobium sp. NBM11]|uniref:methyltransferase n=1 Tax=Novosphingobium sp. NBM11 TaxID=2596914 RepID=UPI0018925771|nr:methyltransferase [Novosphingobium sp. NBM11]MBF5090890.1 methyltransferase [Novosphingobium sp. NBM11]